MYTIEYLHFLSRLDVLAHIFEKIHEKIVTMLSGSQYEVMKLAIYSGGCVILFDFFVDLLVLHRNRGLLYVLNLNLAFNSLWSSLLIVLSFLSFGYLFTVYRTSVNEEKENVDEYITTTIEAFDALRYNLYSMKLAIHSSHDSIAPPDKVLDSMEEGLSASINLIDSYLEKSI